MNWNEIKKMGSEHYQGKAEPIDLYKSGNMLQDFAITNIIKYAYRNRRELGKTINMQDMKKIIHYAEMLYCMREEEIKGQAL